MINLRNNIIINDQNVVSTGYICTKETGSACKMHNSQIRFSCERKRMNEWLLKVEFTALSGIPAIVEACGIPLEVIRYL